MPADRFFIEGDLKVNEVIRLEGDEFHHLRVMRPRAGETIEIINGKGVLAKGLITLLEKKFATLAISEVIQEENTSPPLILIQAIPKQAKLELILEKGTELGASAFWLIETTRSEKATFSPTKHERMRQITISATKQSGRLTLPKIEVMPSLDQLKVPKGNVFFGDVSKPASTFPSIDASQPSSFFVGPESGFTKSEVDILQKNLGAEGVSLSRNILRTETAAITALALISNKMIR